METKAPYGTSWFLVYAADKDGAEYSATVAGRTERMAERIFKLWLTYPIETEYIRSVKRLGGDE